MSVRCLVWRGEGEVVIGCLDGLVHRWVVGAGPKVMFAMDGSIIHMRWNHTHKVTSLTVYYLYTTCILQYITYIVYYCILLVYSIPLI